MVYGQNIIKVKYGPVQEDKNSGNSKKTSLDVMDMFEAYMGGTEGRWHNAEMMQK